MKALLWIGVAIWVAAPAWAQTSQLTGFVNATAVMFTPGPGQAFYNVDNVYLLNDPAATRWAWTRWSGAAWG